MKIYDLRGYLIFEDEELQDLQHADLRGVDLEGANLYGANLEGADLRGANLDKANLRLANLRYANLEGAYLYGTDLEGANLEDLKGKRILTFSVPGKQFAYYCDDYIKIGGTKASIAQWLCNYKAICKRWDLSKEEIELYGDFIKMCAKLNKEDKK